MLNHTITLSNVTYCGIDGRIDPYTTGLLIKHAEFASRYFTFHKIKILTPAQNHIKHDLIEFIDIKPINNLIAYSEFCLRHLHEYIDSQFCLLYQWDGCIVNPHLWDNHFLDYDYIGAPWPMSLKWLEHYPCREVGIVGNGGFSLRSLKLLQECVHLPRIDDKMNEDVLITLTCRQHLLSKGLKFADLETGKRFSIEIAMDTNHTLETTFGFHSSQHLATFLHKTYAH